MYRVSVKPNAAGSDVDSRAVPSVSEAILRRKNLLPLRMRVVSGRFVSLLILTLIALPWRLPGVIIDRVAAVVDKEVITLTEVEQLVALRVLTRLPGEADSDYRRRVLDSMVAQALRSSDVERFGAEDVSKDSIESRLLEITERLGGEAAREAALRKAELTLDELRAIVKRQLQVDAYVEEKFSPLIFVSLEEIETYYRATWTEQRRQRGLAIPPLSEAREEIRSILKSERLQAEIATWTAQLRARANVDVFVYR